MLLASCLTLGYHNYASEGPKSPHPVCRLFSSVSLVELLGKLHLPTKATLINFCHCHCVQLTLLINFIRVICWHSPTGTHTQTHRRHTDLYKCTQWHSRDLRVAILSRKVAEVIWATQFLVLVPLPLFIVWPLCLLVSAECANRIKMRRRGN